MVFYIVSIVGGTFFIGLFNVIFNLSAFDGSIVLGFALSVAFTVEVILVDGLFSTVVRWALPKKWFQYGKKGFCASKRECRFYDFIGIKKWKDKIIELGSFTGFHKDKIKNPDDNEYIERFILEANYGVICHVACCLFGFLIMFIPPVYCRFSVALPVAIINFILNLLPVLALRYNLPRLYVVHKFNERKKKTA